MWGVPEQCRVSLDCSSKLGRLTAQLFFSHRLHRVGVRQNRVIGHFLEELCPVGDESDFQNTPMLPTGCLLESGGCDYDRSTNQ